MAEFGGQRKWACPARQRFVGLRPGLLRVRVGLWPFGGRAQAYARCAGGLEVARVGQATVSRENGAQQGNIAHAAAKSADGVQRFRQAFDTGAADPVVAGLVAHHTAIGSGANQRAGRLRAQGQRQHAVGYGSRRAAGRAARRVRQLVRVARDARAHVGQLGADGLAHHHRAGIAAQRHGSRISQRLVARVNRRAIAGGHVHGVE